ncbi:MAG: ABC transporter ATP-binding protein [Alphaproteobacteria bacterium]|nr:ABC transporter ATP-binding protein [Alphaproteobacteria bacterium]
MTEAALEVEGLVKHFAVRGGGWFGRRARVHAVDDVSFSLARGETLALVGESGSGKTTVGRMIVGLTPPTAGSVTLFGTRIDGSSRAAMRPHRRRLQLVFQDPYASLNPRMTAADLIGEPLLNFGMHSKAERRTRAAEVLARVGLRRDYLDRLPHEFSGGQRQRLGIARALAVGPDVIVCDEPVSALDVSVQAQVINLLVDLQAELGLSYLFIAHDLAVVQHVSDRTAVMYLGRIVEQAPTRALFASPRHPYTRALLASVPVPDPAVPRTRVAVEGEVPSAIDPPPGCRFHTRCPDAREACRRVVPALDPVSPGHFVACHVHGAQGQTPSL